MTKNRLAKTPHNSTKNKCFRDWTHVTNMGRNAISGKQASIHVEIGNGCSSAVGGVKIYMWDVFDKLTSLESFGNGGEIIKLLHSLPVASRGRIQLMPIKKLKFVTKRTVNTWRPSVMFFLLLQEISCAQGQNTLHYLRQCEKSLGYMKFPDLENLSCVA